MYQSLSETISVVGIYHNYKFTPKKFRWRHQVLAIDQVTLVSNVKDGGIKKRLYSVVVGPNVYRLSFNRETEAWKVEEVWCE